RPGPPFFLSRFKAALLLAGDDRSAALPCDRRGRCRSPPMPAQRRDTTTVMTASGSPGKGRTPSATAEQILDLAETLIQTRSYSAFSYQDVSDALGLTKASIHYHFPSKAELGVAVIDRYVARFGAQLAALEQDEATSSMALLDFYVQPYLQFAKTD